jgi:uncharacterized protein YbjT (DUF2867 family)
MIVVTGATGNVGQPLVAALAEAGEDVIAVSRRPGPASPGIRPYAADLTEPVGLKPALEAADALFLLLAGEALIPGEHHDVLPRLLDGMGAARVVLLSSQGTQTRPDFAAYAPMRALEDSIRGSGRDVTVLRPSGFHSNALMWAGMVRSQRRVIAPFGDVGLPLIDPADVAAAAAVILRGADPGAAAREPGHYELTGPALVSPRTQAAAIGHALGEPVWFAEQDPAAARQDLLALMPPDVVEGTLAIIGAPLPAEQEVSPDFERLVGREPGSFADWAARHAAAFR